ncbi:unnamed protein product, partial [Effrenium voratum]
GLAAPFRRNPDSDFDSTRIAEMSIPGGPEAAELEHMIQHGELTRLYGVRLAEIPERGLGYCAVRRIKRGEALLFDRARCSALVGEEDVAQLAAQVGEGSEVMALTHGAGSDDVLGKIQNNVFHATRDVEWCALFLGVARLNHSCLPNAFVDCSRSCAVVRALTEIQEAAEVLISYVPVSDALAARSEQLRHKGFDCDCARCREEAQGVLLCACGAWLPEEAAACPCGADAATLHSASAALSQANEFMQSPEAAKTDTRQLIAKLTKLKEECYSNGPLPQSADTVTFLNNLSNLHFFSAQHLAGPQREEALVAFYECKRQLMASYEALHGGSAQRDVSFLLALQRLLALEPPQELRKLWQQQLLRACLLQFGQMQLPPNLQPASQRPEDVLLDEPDTRFCICYDETSPVIIACLWAKLQGAGVEDVVACLCEERAEWDKAGESHLVQAAETADPTMEEVYQSVIRCPRPFWDREVLKRQWRLPLDCATGKGYALVSRSIEEGNHDPERVQAFVHKAGALLRPANGEEVSRIANCASTEITSCSQIDMGGLIPAWATSYLSSVVVGKAVSWTDNLKRHCAARNGGESSCGDQLDQLQLMQRWKKRTGFARDNVTTSTTCSAKDAKNVESMETALKAMSNWAIAEDVKSAMEMVTGEAEEEYEKILEDTIPVTVGSQSWLDRLESVGKSVVTYAAGKIPVIGGVVEKAIDLFWPESGDVYDIWQLIVGEVSEMVDVKILAYELRERYADLLALKREMKRYTRSKSTIDRGNFLSIALAKVEDIIAHLTVSGNKLQLLPLTIATATIHCVILRERVNDGPSLYGVDDGSWALELQSAVAFYQSFFNYTYGDWFAWRSDKVETSSQMNGRRRGTCSSSTKDTLTGTQYDLSWSGEVSNDDRCASAAALQKSRFVRDVARSIIASLRTVMYLQRYVPGMEMKPVQVLPAIKYVTLGPFAYVSQPVSELQVSYANDLPTLAKNCDSGPGNITKVIVRSFNVVDGFQIYYADGQQCIGGGSGGNADEFLLSDDKYITKLKFHFNDPEIATLEMSLSDGSSASFGSGGGDAVEGYVTDDGSYKLVGGVLGSAHNSYLGYFEPTYEFTYLNVWSPDSFSSDIMKTGETLAANSGLQSPNGMYKLFLQNDANLVIYDIYDRATWSSDTQNKCPNASPELVLQSDGNLVLYCGCSALWAAGTETDSTLCRMVAMQNDGSLAMYNVGNESGVWSSKGSIPLGFGASNLSSPDSLAVGQRLVQSYFLQYELSIDAGKPVLREWQKSSIWSSSAGCNSTDSFAHLKMQEDGNLVLYCDEGNTISPWASDTADTSLEKLSGVNVLSLLPNGNLRIVNKRGEVSWTSGSAQAYQYFPPSISK